jgi:hypothetical protein
MKGDSENRLNIPPRDERAILDEIRKDHDLIERLKITPRELEALSKCVLLGTLTCKQDMLFILRQIREATASNPEHAAVFPKPPEADQPDEDSGADLRHVMTHATPIVSSEPGSLDTIVRRRIPERLAILVCVIALVAGLVWNAGVIMSGWRAIIAIDFGIPVSQGPGSNTWYSRLDHLNVLLFWEFLIVGAIAFGIHLRSKRYSRRFKVRPGGRLR